MFLWELVTYPNCRYSSSNLFANCFCFHLTKSCTFQKLVSLLTGHTVLRQWVIGPSVIDLHVEPWNSVMFTINEKYSKTAGILFQQVWPQCKDCPFPRGDETLEFSRSDRVEPITKHGTVSNAMVEWISSSEKLPTTCIRGRTTSQVWKNTTGTRGTCSILSCQHLKKQWTLETIESFLGFKLHQIPQWNLVVTLTWI